MPTRVLKLWMSLHGIRRSGAASPVPAGLGIIRGKDKLEIVHEFEDFALLRDGHSAALAARILRDAAPESKVAVSMTAALAIRFPAEEMSRHFFEAIRRNFPLGEYMASSARFSFTWKGWEVKIDLAETSPCEYRAEAELNRKQNPAWETADSIEALGAVFQEWLEGLRQHGFTP